MHFDVRLCGMCTFWRKSLAFHPFKCHLFSPFLLPCPFLAIWWYCSSQCRRGLMSGHVGSVQQWISKPFNTVFVNISELFFFFFNISGEYSGWYVKNILLSIHMALLILARCKATPTLPPCTPPLTCTDGDLCCWFKKEKKKELPERSDLSDDFVTLWPKGGLEHQVFRV